MAMYSLIETRAGTSARCTSSHAPARRIARNTASSRPSGHSSTNAAEMSSVEPLLVGGDAANDVGEERRVGLGQLVAVDLLVEPIAGEFAHHRFGSSSGFSSSW